MKTCSKCNSNKDLNEYYQSKRSSDGRQAMCKTCMKGAYQRCRKKKLVHYRSLQKQRIQANSLRYNQWKATQHCAHCPESDPVCLDLHHIDPKQKDNVIANVMSMWSWERLQKEIAKCIVLCANCHRKEHYQQRTKLV